MPSRTALGAAGLALTVAGGVSALFLTIGPIGSTSTDGTASTTGSTVTEQGVVVEYVDQYGNPIDPSTLQRSEATSGGVAAVPGTVADSSLTYHDDDDDDDEDEGREHEDHEHEEHEDGDHDDD